MPRFLVAVRYSQEKEIGVWAKDRKEAMDKAEEIVGNWFGILWFGILNAEAQDCDEE